MRAPQSIIGEWGALTRVHSRERNLESIAKISEWLNCVEDYLRAGGDPGAEALLTNYTATNAKGLSTTEYDGVPMATLRFWLKWWESPERTWCGAEEIGRHPAEQAAKVRREIEAREAAGGR